MADEPDPPPFIDDGAREAKARKLYAAAHDMIAVADAEALVERLHKLLWSNTGADRGSQSGKTMRLTIEVPQEWVMLAAWMRLRRADRRMGRQRRFATMIEDRPSAGTVRLAKAEFWLTLHEEFHTAMHLLAIGSHAILEPENEPAASPIDPEHDIPF